MSLVVSVLAVDASTESEALKSFNDESVVYEQAPLIKDGAPLKSNVDLLNGYYSVAYTCRDGVRRLYLRRGGYVWDNYLESIAIASLAGCYFLVSASELAAWVGIDASSLTKFVCLHFC